jgi:hypothetical protein
MKKILPSFFVLLVLYALPASALAQAGFVSCDGIECNTCHIVEMGNTVLNWLIGVLFLVFGIVMAAAGWGLVTSAGNQTALENAKSKFTNAFIGLIIVLAAWLLVDTIMRGLLSTGDGSIDGFGPWSQVECVSPAQTSWESTEIDFGSEVVFFATTPGGNCPIGFIHNAFGDCEPQLGPVLPDAGGNCPIGYVFDAFGSTCELQSGPISPDAGGNCPAGYVFDAFGDCEFSGGSGPGNVTVNDAMGPIFDPAQGGSSMVHSGAEQRMQATLAGPYATMQRNFGRPVVINDGIAKAGSSRETNTPGSRHFHGDALDLSTRGLSNADKIRLYEEARRAGFSGFGFGTNILHVDLGPSRAWAYGNSTYGGQSVCSLGVRC